MSEVRPAIAVLAAVAHNGVIGRDGALPWHLPRDLRRFRQITMGHAIIMGRKTFDSIGRALPGRHSIVISRQSQLTMPAGVALAGDLEAALGLAESLGSQSRAFVIGGRQVYAEALPRAKQLFLTRVEADVTGNVYFPDVDWNQWTREEEEHFEPDERHEYPLTFEVWRRI